MWVQSLAEGSCSIEVFTIDLDRPLEEENQKVHFKI